jgi:hypothetical protein
VPVTSHPLPNAIRSNEANVMKKVELHSAYVWDCDECGTENFVRAVTIDLNPDDEEDAKAIEALYPEGVPEGAGVKAMTCPNRVVCKHCKTEFKSESPHQTLEDEDDQDER